MSAPAAAGARSDARATPRTRTAFLVALAVLAAAWLPRLVPGFASTDDLFRFGAREDGEVLRTMLMQGRPLQAGLYALLAAAGIDPVSSGSLLNLAALLLLAASAVLLLRAWRIPATPGAAAVAALAFVHPSLAEVFTFRSVPVFLGVATALATLGLAWLREGRRAAGIAAVIASFCTYQLTASLLAVAVGVGVALACTSPSGEEDAPTRWVRPALSLVAAVVGYLVLQRAVLAVAGLAPLERARFVSDPATLLAGLRAAPALLRRVLWREPALSAPLLSWAQVGALAAAVLACIEATRRGPSGSRAEARDGGLARAALALAGVALAVVCTVALLLVLREPWPAPRVLSAAGVLWAGLLLLGLRARVGTLRVATVGLGVVLLLGAAGLDHRVASDQLRLNARDLARASRIADRLEALPGWLDVRRVATVGTPPPDPDIPSTYDLNVSALARPWSRAALLREVTGRPLAPATPEDEARAGARCDGAPRWPAPGSVAVDGALAVVCF